jgi:putative ABC transport system ATP-binding protein
MPITAPTSSAVDSVSASPSPALLATHPKIVLADEPTANLDHKTGEDILRLMKQLNHEEGTTFIFSTHDARVMEMADRVIELADGQITE